MLGIITGTIAPGRGVGQLVLKDEKQRLKQYEEGVEFFINSGAFSTIIFCDNSNYNMESFDNLKKCAEGKGIKLELMSFQGDVDQVAVHGKGYGEGEIMKYVVNHSKLIGQEEFFVKITGRLKVINIRDIIRGMDTCQIYFNIPNSTRRDIYDTRMYGMPILIFRQYFENQYDEVQDNYGIFLEHVYTNIINNQCMKVRNFPRYPRIIGVSGSNGIEYGYTEWKCRIKDLLSKINYYKVKET